GGWGGGARRYRKMLGGGMRQAGVLAATGLVAVTTMVERLADDHRSAQALAQALATLPGIVLDPATVETNILVFELAAGLDPVAFKAELLKAGLKITNFGPTRLRMVTHHGVEAADVALVVETVSAVLAKLHRL
ncbi:MAG: threonine aldolase, partial [Candidatus Sericytochromatia bacterium]|nr:threonine aldolase [Candidatus Sericytochromatia bacterium]